MISRRKDYSKKEPSKDARKIYIVCEGDRTEPDYFSFFEGLSSNLEVIIVPPHDHQSDPQKLMELAEATFLAENSLYLLDYMDRDTVWFAIDADTWIKEGKVAPLRDFCKRMNEQIPQIYDEVKAYSAWNVVQSNPCFEIWLYYHHLSEMPSASEVEKYASMKEYLDQKVAGGFDYQRDQVRLTDAILNSGNNFRTDSNNNPTLFSTEQHLLGTEIMRFVNKEIQKLRNKI